jgi:beta-glucanase (GH16 family)
MLLLVLSVERELVFGQSTGTWHVVWADEFVGAANSNPDPTKWKYDLGNGGPLNPGWGNNEIQEYTDSKENVFLDGSGHLVIRALKKTVGYTSGRITTQNKFEFTYGKVEARIRIPYARGIWPALFMLGANYGDAGWPLCGEIDIMENFGVQSGDASINRGTMHGPGYSGTGITGIYKLPMGKRLSDDFHTFSIEWGADVVEFFVDGTSYLKASRAVMPARSTWVFNSPFFLILNLAVGGSPAPVGYPDGATPFPQEMLVDYVRVYKH